MNDGQVDKMFHVFGSKSREILNQFTKFKKNRFYLDSKQVGDCYCEFIIIDENEIESKDFNLWIEEIEPINPIIFIVDDKKLVSDDSLIADTLKFSEQFDSSNIFSIKSHGELVSVLEGVSELQNRFSLMEVDFADFELVFENGRHYWSDMIYSQSIDKLILKIVEKLENVKVRAKNNDLKVSGLFGCIKGNISSFKSNICEEYELIMHTLKELEPLFDCDSSRLIIHTNVEIYEKIDEHEDLEIGFHMLWTLSDK
ncbi:MAG: hypothetical protein ACI9VT_001821 [Psychroserpens sp.]|jgi:hypothetical protein